MKVYLASGWFTDEMERARLEALTLLKSLLYEVYSPKDDMLFEEGMNPDDVFNDNIKHIVNCDFVLASTEGRDTGTIFECGVAYQMRKPIVYYWKAPEGVPFNLMLSQSAYAVATSELTLSKILASFQQNGKPYKIPYEGDIE